ncbi:type II toxin-antitoxin system RelE/ParE family toxin [Asticcacaulis taihuensis]|uniref:type II toxin-antitoxin system RelE/ParE family toxin n=1 Tax=Asticcacaulis taihuensis TaxID=260084 RepID=UPI0026F208BC|nr:type II toxin-antitoxin system RelE/ParE family toxin [Asticcacaulis taihuensis]
MLTVRQTETFKKWLTGLKDAKARARIQVRMDRASLGNLGDHKFFEGIGEMRIDYGPGYRVYFVQEGRSIVLLLSGGDKSTQEKDIQKALKMLKEL